MALGYSDLLAMFVYSRSTMDASPTDDEPQKIPHQLHLIRYSRKHACHWSLFLPSTEADPHTGIQVHVGSDKVSKHPEKWSESRCCGPSTYVIMIDHFNKKAFEDEYIERQENTERKPRDYRFTPIAGAFCTLEQFEQVANEVYKGGTYNYAFNNCQHFCINVIKRLHKLYPASVTEKGLENIHSMQTSYTRVTTSSRQKLVISESPQAEQSGMKEDDTAALEKELGIRKLFNSFSKPRVSRPTTPQSGSSGDRHSASFEGSD